MYHNEQFFSLYLMHINIAELLQHPLWGHTRAEQRETIPTFILQDRLLLMHPRIQLAFYAVNALCWIMCSYLSPNTPKSFFSRLLIIPLITQFVFVFGIALT